MRGYRRATTVRVGDVIHFLGSPHLIERIDPNEGPFAWITGYARSADGWGIALEPTVTLEVSRI